MRGTEKQIVWAEDIKAKVVAVLTDCRNRFVNMAEYDAANPEHVRVAENFIKNIQVLESEEYAGDIIDMFSTVRADDCMKAYVEFRLALKISCNSHKKNYIY